jgi:hypothetical protein
LLIRVLPVALGWIIAAPAAGYVSCEHADAVVMLSDHAIVGRLGAVTRDTTGYQVHARGDLVVEQDLFGRVAAGDTLQLTWEYTRPEYAVKSPRDPDFGRREGEWVLWLIVDRENGTVAVQSKHCGVWPSGRGFELLFRYLTYRPEPMLSLDPKPEENYWKLAAVYEYLEGILDQETGDAQDLQRPN